MKKSNYNFFLERENRVYCFNALTSKFFSIEKSQKKVLDKILDHADLYLDNYPSFKKMLLEGRFLLDDEENEVALICQENACIVDRKDYELIILPTLSCNFSCWYCVQHHKPEYMSEATIQAVCNHLKYMIQIEKITSLSIEWFGGEPLLFFDKVIFPILSYAQRICLEAAIPYTSGITTNGYLINEAKLKKMKEVNLRSFQITLDGVREFHDKTRIAPNCSSFDKILNNVTMICQVLDNAQITLRVNYDEKNFQPHLLVKEISERIDGQYFPNIEILLRKVWQTPYSKEGYENIRSFVKMAKDKGIKIAQHTFINASRLRCYACKKYFNSIAPNGGIYKCTARTDYSSVPWGKLKEDGTIQWLVENFEDHFYGRKNYENDQCLKCKYLPLCMGPCPKKMEENGLKKMPFVCEKLQPNDLSFEEGILEYCIYNQ